MSRLPTDARFAQEDAGAELRSGLGARNYLAASGSGITMLISHRFSTVRMTDLIAVLDHEQLTGCGTHRELMTVRGLYAVVARYRLPTPRRERQ
jgi:ATP-binding cassette, subfamily B, bacterial